jgi:hypothetical protein
MQPKELAQRDCLAEPTPLLQVRRRRRGRFRRSNAPVHPLDHSSCLARRMARGYRERSTKKSGTVSNSEVEAAAVFIAKCMLDDELNGATAGVWSHIGTYNKATEGWYNREASRWLAMR